MAPYTNFVYNNGDPTVQLTTYFRFKQKHGSENIFI